MAGRFDDELPITCCMTRRPLPWVQPLGSVLAAVVADGGDDSDVMIGQLFKLRGLMLDLLGTGPSEQCRCTLGSAPNATRGADLTETVYLWFPADAYALRSTLTVQVLDALIDVYAAVVASEGIEGALKRMARVARHKAMPPA